MVVDVNLNGCFYFCHEALPVMRAQGHGTVINVTSIAGLRALPFAGAAYCASKAGMNSLGDMINLEDGPNGIRCTSICPGEVDTPILDKRPVPPPPERRAQMIRAEDLGEVCVMVASLPPRVTIPKIVITGATTLEHSV